MKPRLHQAAAGPNSNNIAVLIEALQIEHETSPTRFLDLVLEHQANHDRVTGKDGLDEFI
jgi:hypothetical protein